MKLTNFRHYHRTGTRPKDFRFHAVVDRTTGALWWKRTTACEVERSYAGNWFFVASGEFTPGFDVERMERSANAKLGDKRLTD